MAHVLPVKRAHLALTEAAHVTLLAAFLEHQGEVLAIRAHVGGLHSALVPWDAYQARSRESQGLASSYVASSPTQSGLHVAPHAKPCSISRAAT